ncbi:MAG TPA: STM4013/SEN3800 family hydrolase [Pirellulales bacterium]|nr:STM4013/SEN3800 family hydrolase [Pirellulales bacterium]
MNRSMPAALRDIVLITFDALRFDVADAAWREGRTPVLREAIPQGWQPRHTPGSFTYAAHAAFFAGFWPTPTAPGAHTRPFALNSPESHSNGPDTLRLPGDNLVTGLRARGFETVCVGGVGFFNPATPLGAVFPGYFERSYWLPEFSVTELHSARAQVRQACACIAECFLDRPLFLFLNISATHPPTHGYVRGACCDSVETQTAALEYVDRQLPPLFASLIDRGRGGVAYLMSDHGTLFGEDGWTGHRVGHPVVWTVPYAEVAWGALP